MIANWCVVVDVGRWVKVLLTKGSSQMLDRSYVQKHRSNNDYRKVMGTQGHLEEDLV